MDARREAGRRPSAPALALLLPWLLLTLVATFRDGGSSPMGLAIAAVGAILASAVALAIASTARLGLPRPSGAGVVALTGAGLWCAMAFASIAWSLSPAASWKDAIHVACATAAIAGGMWIGALLRRPAQAACLVLLAVAVTVAIYSIAQRSFNGEFIARRSRACASRSAMPTRSPRCSSRGPTALVLGTRRELAARAAAAASICVLVVALVLTGSRGGILATLLAIVVVLVLAGRRLELVATLAAGRDPRRAGRALRREPADVLRQRASALGRQRPAPAGHPLPAGSARRFRCDIVTRTLCHPTCAIAPGTPCAPTAEADKCPN